MIVTQRKQKIWLAQHRVDFRRQHNGLLAEAYKVGLDPFAGDVVIFVGKNRRSIKILYADPTGLWLSWKKFTMESMKTAVGFLLNPSCRSITAAELAMLLEGSAYTIGKRVKNYINDIDQRSSIREGQNHNVNTQSERTSGDF